MRPQAKWTVKLVTVEGHFYSSPGMLLNMYGLTYSLYHPRAFYLDGNKVIQTHPFVCEIIYHNNELQVRALFWWYRP